MAASARQTVHLAVYFDFTGPWEKDPHYFKDIQISALALLKMVMHARSGGSLEVMGLLLGKVMENTMVGIC